LIYSGLALKLLPARSSLFDNLNLLNAMKTKLQRLIILSFLLFPLACKATQDLQPANPTAIPAATSAATATAIVPATDTPIPVSPTSPPTETVAPTALPSATASPVPSLTPATVIDPLLTTRQLAAFEELWGIVNQNYLYTDFNGLDWNAVRQEYRQRIEAGLSDEDYYLAMSEMIFRLGDNHSIYLSPQEAREDDQMRLGEVDYVGIGVRSILVPEKQSLAVLLVYPGSPADQAGIKMNDNILLVDGQPVVSVDGAHQNLLRGPEGTTINVTVQTPGEPPRTVPITRQRVGGALPVPYSVLTTPQGKRIGYIFMTSFADTSVDESVAQALSQMSAGGQLDGLILDNRFNSGGASDVLLDTMNYFATGLMGYIVDRQNDNPLTVPGVDIGGSQTLPIVALIDEGTASFGEVFAGVLRNLGRAYLIGGQTDGNVEILSIYNLTDGARAQIATFTFRPPNPTGEDWEETGIIPDLSITSKWEEITQQTDPVIQAALDYFDGQ
jgi:C-terminal peptidase prc